MEPELQAILDRAQELVKSKEPFSLVLKNGSKKTCRSAYRIGSVTVEEGESKSTGYVLEVRLLDGSEVGFRLSTIQKLGVTKG